jgi:Glycosyl hydrolases family 39
MFAIFRRLIILMLIPGLLLNSAFAVDLTTPAESIPASYFGMHFHHLNAETPWPDMPVPEWRIWDAYVTWHDLEPYRNQWRFDRLDGYVALAEKHGTGILLPLGMSPTWASARPPADNAEPANMDDWRIFVRTVVTRYKGRIQAYEIWNEPNLKTFWTGTMDQMVSLTKEAAAIIHSVDPKALVVSPSVTATYGTSWLADFLKKGVGQYVDVIGYHFYITPKMPEDLPDFVHSVRQILKDNGLADKPLWDTETGWLEPSHFESEEEAAGVLARAYVLMWASGVQRFYWYAWDNRHVTVKTTKEDHTVTQAGYAYKVIQEWLVGAKMNGCSENSGTWSCQLDRSGRKYWIVWSAQGNRKFDAPKAWRVGSVKPLLHDAHPMSGSSVDIGPVPTLLKEGA